MSKQRKVKANHPKAIAIAFEDCQHPFAYSRGGAHRFWSKIGTGTRLRAQSAQAGRVVR